MTLLEAKNHRKMAHFIATCGRALRLDYGGLGPFCSIHANMYFFSCLLIFQWELYNQRRMLYDDINYGIVENIIKVYTKQELKNCNFV